MTNSPIAVHCTRSPVNSSYSLTTCQCDSVPMIRVLGHSTCRMILTVHAHITCLLAKYNRAVGTQQLVSKHLYLFCTMTNKCTIISQIITLLLHVSTLPCHPQGACNHYPCQVTQVFQMQLLVLHTGPARQ